MRKFTYLPLLLACCFALCFTACSGESYTIQQENGKCYLVLNEPKTENKAESDSGLMTNISYSSPTFQSLAKMKQTILSGEFTDGQIAGLLRGPANEKVILEICDPNTLKDVVLPTDVTLEKIIWTGNTYTFDLKCNITELCNVDYLTEDDYNQSFSKEYVDYPNKSQTIQREEHDESRDATVIYYENDVAEFKTIKYEISDGSRTLYVKEDYTLKYKDGRTQSSFGPAVSDTIPDDVHMFCNDEHGFFEVTLLWPTERPSVEWLSTFRLIPFEG